MEIFFNCKLKHALKKLWIVINSNFFTGFQEFGADYERILALLHHDEFSHRTLIHVSSFYEQVGTISSALWHQITFHYFWPSTNLFLVGKICAFSSEIKSIVGLNDSTCKWPPLSWKMLRFEYLPCIWMRAYFFVIFYWSLKFDDQINLDASQISNFSIWFEKIVFKFNWIITDFCN